MCYTGGPYCYGDTMRTYSRAVKNYEDKPTDDNKLKVYDLQERLKLTPEYINKMKASFPEEGSRLENDYKSKLESAKVHERLRSDNNKQKKLLEAKRDELEVSKSQYSQKIEEVSSNKQWDAEDRQAIIDEYTRQSSLIDGELELNKSRIKVLADNSALNLENHKNGKSMDYSHVMPSQFKEYFESTEKKHFHPLSPGSTFTEAKNLNEVLSLAHRQRGTLDGDDREAFIKDYGADPESFRDDKRYIMVKTGGNLGSVHANQLPKDTMLKVHQKAEGVDPVLVAEVKEKPPVNVATVVLVDNPTLKGTENNSTLLITAFPGVSTARGSNEGLLPYVGQYISMDKASEIFKGNDFSVNTQLAK